MWNESRVLSWPLMFRRQYAQPLDIDSVFETLEEMDTYLTNTLRHVGQIATCQETEGVIYIMNNNRDAWVTVDAGSGENPIKLDRTGKQFTIRMITASDYRRIMKVREQDPYGMYGLT
jgi:hypothetical protein